MEFIKIALSSIFSVAALFTITKIIGARQVSQLSMFDYINGISIGSVAAELSVSQGKAFFFYLISLLIFGLSTLLFSVITDRSIRARRIIAGKPDILFENGKIYDENFKKAHLDLNEFLMQCRNQGFFTLENVSLVMLEENGNISILPKSDARPATPSDMKIEVEQELLPANVILDGEIMDDNLKNIGYNRDWLWKELSQKKIKNVSSVFLATCVRGGRLNIYIRHGEKEQNTLM